MQLALLNVLFLSHLTCGTVVEAWSVSSVSVQDLIVDRRETRNATVFIPEDLLQQQGNGEGVHIDCQLYIH